jgi:hypothetical protein
MGKLVTLAAIGATAFFGLAGTVGALDAGRAG